MHSDLLKQAYAAMRHDLRRTLLTMAGMAWGIATVVLLLSYGNGFGKAIEVIFQSFGATLVQFQKYEARFGGGHRPLEEHARKDLTYEDAMALKASIPEMRAVSPERYLWNTDIHVRYRGSETTSPVVVGATPDYSLANNHFVGYGRFLTETDVEHASTVTVLGEDTRQALFFGVPLQIELQSTVAKIKCA